MLVLTRKHEESIRIGNDITITILRIEGNRVRLGIEAPRDVKVLRTEVELVAEPTSVPTPVPTKSSVSAIPPLSSFLTTTAFAGA